MMARGRRGDDDEGVSNSSHLPERTAPPPMPAEVLSLVDLALGATATATSVAIGAGRLLGVVARPVVDVVLRPPLVPERHRPEAWLAALARQGERRRDRLVPELSALLDALVPALAGEVLSRLDLTEVVIRNVDLDRVVATVDVDAIVRRLDLTRIVSDRVDLNLLVGEVDLDAAVAGVDLDGAVARVDIDAIIARIDLAGLAEEVIAAIDLPEIIRESTGSVASDTVRGFRMQGIAGDEALTRAVDRIRLRRHRTP
jgi:hypothetical protein